MHARTAGSLLIGLSVQVDTSLLTKTPRQVYLRMRSNYYPSFTLIKFVYDYSPTHSKA